MLFSVLLLLLFPDAVDQGAVYQGSSVITSSPGSDDAAACENEAMQDMVSVLQDPTIFKSLGLTEPPQCFRPLDAEVYAASFVRLV